jgi:O-antigen ligase
VSFSPAQCILFETGVFFVFLVMLLSTQWSRSTDPEHRLHNAGAQFRWLALVFVLLTAGLVPLLSGVSPIMGAELAAGLTLALMHPVNALCLFVHLLFLRPWEVMPESAALAVLPRLLAAVCAISWLIHPETHRPPAPGAWRSLGILAAFSLWLFLTTFATPDAAATQLDWFGTFFKVVVVFVMCLFFIGDGRGVAALKRTIVISVLGTVLLALFEFFMFPSAGVYAGRLHSKFTVLDPNDLAAVSVMALPLVLDPVFRAESAAGSRLAGLGLAAAALAAVWYSQSRGALIALFAQVLAVTTFPNLRRRWLGAAFVAVILVAGYAGAMRLSNRTAEEREASSESRMVYWKAAVKMTFHHLLLGVGYDAFPRNYSSYSSGSKYEWGERTAHSSWLLAFAESGLVGGLLFLSFFVSVWRTAWRNRRRRPEQLYALAGYAVAMSFLSHTYLLYPYLMAALVLSSAAGRDFPHAA